MELLQLAALIAFLGMVAQWSAWKLRIPALLILLAIGIVIGPGLQLITFSGGIHEAAQPFISLAVAIILFEGGLTLRWHDLQGVNRVIWRLVILAGPVAGLLGTLAAHYIGHLSLSASIILGGLFIVTGPTVVIPLLRQANLNSKISRIMRWEGIVNDPCGALLAVLAFEIVMHARLDISPFDIMSSVVLGAIIAALLGFVVARLFIWLIERHAVAEYLSIPVLMALVLSVFALSHHIQSDSGLVAVTVMGITLANSRLSILDEILRFKESLAIFLTSVLFVYISASIPRSFFTQFDIPLILFVVVMIVFVRPLAVWLGLIGTGLHTREKLYIGLIAPRGIVALSVAGYFSGQLVARHIPDGDQVLNATFVMVILTVALSSLVAQPLARRLQLNRARSNGVVLVGAYPWSAQFAAQLNGQNIPVLIVDENWRRLKEARMVNVSSYYGSVLSEYADIDLDLTDYRYFIAASDNDAYNTLLCSQMRGRFISKNVLQIKTGADETLAAQSPHALRGGSAFAPPVTWDMLTINTYMGWVFRKTQLTAEYTYEAFRRDMPPDGVVMAWIDQDGMLLLGADMNDKQKTRLAAVISFSPAKKLLA